jgi:hypothetical protein
MELIASQEQATALVEADPQLTETEAAEIEEQLRALGDID